MTDPNLGLYIAIYISGALGGASFMRGCQQLAQQRRRRGSNPPSPGYKPRPPAGPPPGMRREYLYSPATMAECSGPCWEAQDPKACDCGALWRDVLIRQPSFAELLMPGERRPGPTTPKPDIIPKPQPPSGRLIREDRLDPAFRPDWSPCSQPPTTPPPSSP